MEYFKIELSDCPVLESLLKDYKELLDKTNEHN